MSHTDKTRPFWVRVAEHPGRTAVADHDHRDGYCDLPDTPALVAAHARTRCRWKASAEVLYGRDSGCGCDMCTGRSARRSQNRRERRQVRAAMTAATRTHDWDADVPDAREPLRW